ncbi:MAG: succinylglutamate desuccinylase/aspartoacylase family protein [Gammaproteobacteria bacterium]
MNDKRSRIDTDVDFERGGKQVSYLRVPYSSNVSAYGWIGVPIAVINNGEGPSVLCMAGNHGDEYEGQIALAKFVREVDAARVRGRLIVLPATNLPAAMAGARVSPIDDGNLNRRFPGDPDGPPTDMIAHYLTTELLPMCTAVVDLHSGGNTLHYLPSALTREHPDPRIFACTMAALEAFAAPYAYVSPACGEERTLIAVAQSLGLIAIGTELGGSGAVTPTTIGVAERGLRNLLVHFEVIDPAYRRPGDDAPPSRVMYVRPETHYVYAPAPGLFEPAFELGDEVSAGDLAGHVHFVDDPLRPPEPAHFAGSGLVICRRAPAPVQRGDCVAHLAEDYDRA